MYSNDAAIVVEFSEIGSCQSECKRGNVKDSSVSAPHTSIHSYSTIDNISEVNFKEDIWN